MTNLSNGTIVTDLLNETDNHNLSRQGYTIRHIETYHAEDETCITWDAPQLTEADLPF